GGEYHLEFRVLRPDGTIRWLNSHGRVRYDEEGKPQHVAGIVMDITDDKVAETQVRWLNKELEARVQERTAQLVAANQELEAFSYSVSHDLRAPLRTIDGFSRILLDTFADELDTKAQHYLQRIRQNTLHLGQLVDDLLQFSRLNRQSLRKREVEPRPLVEEVLGDLASMQEGRDVQVEIEPLPPCEADPTLLQQVYVNLLGNALKYTRSCKTAHIKVGARQSNEREVPIYYVADNGVGFDMKYAHKLFGVFQRLHRAEDFEGTGVGLALVQRIIHRHGGEVWAEAAPNQGATFYFTLTQGYSHEG
ncbi:MAG TPA: ATP-binding protein, partial [Rhodothermales bacterium]|nr:ATP-binding protein [Rhodothermales bacterium]